MVGVELAGDSGIDEFEWQYGFECGWSDAAVDEFFYSLWLINSTIIMK